MSIGFVVEPIMLAIAMLQAIILRPRLLSWGPIEHLGKISYGAYLYQQLGVPAGQSIFPGSNPLADLIAGIALSFLAAELSYRFVERPFLSLKQRYRAGTD
jgi:peptidoglycan/LPS O-acetylase OafA/YrhL